jgi:hypothetical protein
VFEKIQIEKVFLFKGPKTQTLGGASPRYYGATVAMALYNQGSGIPVIPMNRMRPPPQRGTGLAQGGRSIKTRNSSLKCDYTQKILHQMVPIRIIL